MNYLEGDASALSTREVEELYASYGHLVLRRSRTVLRHETLAQDALQNVFIKVIRHGAGLRKVESKLAWLYTVTDRCCIDLIKSHHRELQLEDDTMLDQRQFTLPMEARSVLGRLFGKLDARERMVALLLFGDGLTQEEISQRLGWSRQTVNKKAQYIRQLALKVT